MDFDNLCFGCMEERGPDKTCPHYSLPAGAGPESALHLPPGTVLHEKYLLGRALSQGGFGITYLAWDVILELKLAVKEFFPMGLVARSAGSTHVETYTGEQGEQFNFGLERFLREAKTLARFEDHPNIVTVRDFFKDNNTAYMVMNHIEGLTLESYPKKSGEKIAFPAMLEIMMPVMDALQEVHRMGVMHRDISPDNIFIDNKGRVVLIDFGAARQEIKEKSKSLSVILKAGYAPEEQYRSKGKQSPWTDVYAVAATMYRAITGITPPESMDRLVEDAILYPSEIRVPEYYKNIMDAINVSEADNIAASMGGGIVLAVGSTPTLTGNTITGNQADRNGGGVLIEESEPNLENNNIAQNTADNGGGIFIMNSTGTALLIAKNRIAENVALVAGGGIYMKGSTSEIREIQIIDNVSKKLGAGAAIYNSAPLFRDNRFEGNEAKEIEGGGAIWVSVDSTLQLYDPDNNNYIQNIPNDIRFE
jgi:parallel beta-helix repeat protein